MKADGSNSRVRAGPWPLGLLIIYNASSNPTKSKRGGFIFSCVEGSGFRDFAKRFLRLQPCSSTYCLLTLSLRSTQHISTVAENLFVRVQTAHHVLVFRRPPAVPVCNLSCNLCIYNLYLQQSTSSHTLADGLPFPFLSSPLLFLLRYFTPKLPHRTAPHRTRYHNSHPRRIRRRAGRDRGPSRQAAVALHCRASQGQGLGGGRHGHQQQPSGEPGAVCNRCVCVCGSLHGRRYESGCDVHNL